MLGAEIGEISLDARWADFGELGHVSLRWPGTAPNDEEFAFARAVVACAGPLVSDAWGLDRSRGDRAKVEEARWPSWTPDAWAFVVIHKTERLVRSEPFRRLHRRIVAALDEVGDTGTLSGDALDRALTTIPDAGFPPGALRPSYVPTSADVLVIRAAGWTA